MTRPPSPAGVGSSMTGPEWDVVVVGAGPAGCAAAAGALEANPASRVLLLDRQRFPRDKPCGDGIAGEALEVLAELVSAWTRFRGLPAADSAAFAVPGWSGRGAADAAVRSGGAARCSTPVGGRRGGPRRGAAAPVVRSVQCRGDRSCWTMTSMPGW